MTEMFEKINSIMNNPLNELGLLKEMGLNNMDNYPLSSQTGMIKEKETKLSGIEKVILKILEDNSYEEILKQILSPVDYLNLYLEIRLTKLKTHVNFMSMNYRFLVQDEIRKIERILNHIKKEETK